MIEANQTLLFQGDSITDASRNQDAKSPNVPVGFGTGYAHDIAAELLSSRPADNLTIYNRGISGNRVTTLFTRWRADAIHLKPDVISILIGVNDCWHKFKSDTGTSLPVYEQVYRLLLANTREDLPKVKFVLCEPFALPCGGFQQEWLDELKQRAAIVRKLAVEFDAVFVPFQQLFDGLVSEASAEYWLPDGVHPSLGGHKRMANLWVKTVCP